MPSKILIALLCLFVTALQVSAQALQQEHIGTNEKRICTWDEFVETFSTSYFDDNETPNLSEERLDALRTIHDNPLDINTASRDELLDLPFISPVQVDSIISYVSKYGPLLSLGELSLIPLLDYQTRFLLTAFLVCKPVKTKPNTKKLLLNGKHDIALNIATPLYTAAGYKDNSSLNNNNKYLGDKNRAALKYSYNYKDEFKYGIAAEKDAGEPFACRGNALFDSYSFHFFRKQKNGKYILALGDYRVNLGEGLIAGNMYFSGKKIALSNYYNNRNILTPHTSYSERDFFRGVAGSLRFGRFLTTILVSYKPNDAITNDSNNITSITNTGYHRTIPEQKRRGNLNDLTIGGDLSYNHNIFKLGISAISTHYDKKLSPRNAEYNRYAMRGKDFHAFSLHYAVNHKALSSRGEAAMSETNAMAFVNTIKWRATNRTTLVNILRSYSMKYVQPYAECFKSSGRVNNEQGIYLGAKSEVLKSLTLQGYIDIFHSPWPSYKYRAPVNGTELFFEAYLHNTKGNFVSAEWKFTNRKLDAIYITNDSSDKNKNLVRIQAGATFNKFTTRTALSFSSSKDKGKTNHGWAISQRVNYTTKRITLASAASYFHTSNYATRIYAYESNVKYNYANFSNLYGEGIRASLLCSARLSNKIRCYAKYGITHYFDRETISTGAQAIASSSKSDLDFCINVTI